MIGAAQGLCAALLVARATASAPTTEVQDEVAAACVAAAVSASAAAADDALTLFSDPALAGFLAELDDGTGLQFLAPEDLMQRFFDEVGAAELVHNFGDASDEANCGFDITLALAPDLDEFDNQWLLQTSGEIPVDSAQNTFSEWSETVIFGFPPFANVSAPDEQTANDRPIYAAANMYRGSGGNPQCGGISAVFSRAYLGSSVLVTPIDTGLFEGSCDQGRATQAGDLGGVPCLVCGEWPEGQRTLGSPGHLNHMLGPFLRFFNATQVGDSASPEAFPGAACDDFEIAFARAQTQNAHARTHTSASIKQMFRSRLFHRWSRLSWRRTAGTGPPTRASTWLGSSRGSSAARPTSAPPAAAAAAAASVPVPDLGTTATTVAAAAPPAARR